VTADAGSLWIRRADRFLRHIDATTNRESEILTLP